MTSGFAVDPSTAPDIQVYLNSYLPPADGGAAQFLFSGQYQSAPAGNGWNDYTFSVTGSTYHATGFDITKIESHGVILQTPGAPATDGGHTTPTPATVYVDSFSVD